ncbi:MAG TPA: class I SAM-dependent methyltransferase [Terriglobales bacterium]|nr:class I SAM-dependent methyltransferase [Terriglobales bacterium]
MSGAAQQPGSSDRPNPGLLMKLSFAFAETQVLQTATELDLFTHIDNGLHTARELAEASHANERGVRILANALVGLKVLDKDGDRFLLTDAAKTFLSKKSSAYLGGWFKQIDEMKAQWRNLNDVVRTGRPATKVEVEEHGAEFFARLVESLYVMGSPGADAGARHVVQGRRGLRVLDIGAGSGVWGIHMAKHDPEARVTVADFAQVIEVTKKFVARNAMTDRFEYLPGNFRETDFGEAKFDIATLGHICHSEGPQHTKELLSKIRRALKPDGQLVIGEFLVDEERKENEFGLLFAVNMLVHTEEGDTFSITELSEWLREAGFGDVEVMEAPAPSPLIIGKVAAARENRKVA